MFLFPFFQKFHFFLLDKTKVQDKKAAKLRPYAELFLDELSELCEIVVWSSSSDFVII